MGGGSFEPELIFPSVVGKIIETVEIEEEEPENDENTMETDAQDDEKKEKDKDQEESKNKIKTIQKIKYLVGDLALCRPRKDIEMIYPIHQGGIINNITAYKELVKFAFKSLSIDPKEHPIIFSEPAWNKTEVRNQLAEFMFKEMKCPAIQILPTPLLALFSQARSTGLVVDIGHTQVSITPIIEGRVIHKGILRNLFGGDFLKKQCKNWLSRANEFTDNTHGNFWPLILPYQIKDKKEVTDGRPPLFDVHEKYQNVKESVSPSWREYQENLFYEDMCAHLVQVSDKSLKLVDVTNLSNKHFEFPNGYHIDMNNQRIQIAEYMFDPTGCDLNANSMLGLFSLITRSSRTCETDVRQMLLSNIHLCGGGAAINGLADRLNYEIQMQVGHKFRLISPATYQSGGLHRPYPYLQNERRYATWIGGSIIASMGSFHSLWITEQEWSERQKGEDIFQVKKGLC